MSQSQVKETKAETEVKHTKIESDETKEEDLDEVDEGDGAVTTDEMAKTFNVITGPKACQAGYRMDAHGKCRKII